MTIEQWTITDESAMRAAIALGRLGTSAVRPNPLVGCVLVKDSEIIGEGFHARAGGPHAEVVALAEAGERARGSTAFVTLEPCNHFGRTPPCARALVDAGIQRVVIGVADPNPQAQGGAQALRDAGIDVQIGVCAAECRDLAEVFLVTIETNRPFVQLKIAMTLDGRIAAADGSSQWITGVAARGAVQALRGQSDAILIGSGTAVADNPRLNVRDNSRQTQTQPLRVVADRRLRLSPQSHLANTADQRTWILTDGRLHGDRERRTQLQNQGIELIDVRADAADWLREALVQLRQRGVQQVLCEGGAQLGSALLTGHLVDRLDCFIAPKLLGAGRNAVENLSILQLAHAQSWRFAAPQAIGDDVWLTARPIARSQSE